MSAEKTPTLDYSKQLFGLDVSAYQGKINWDLLANGPIKPAFVAIRAGISWGYTDKWFARNWAEAKRVGLPRSAYHVLYPAEPIRAQVDHFLKILGTDQGELPVTPDIELDHGQAPKKIQAAVYEFDCRLRDATKRTPINYSRTTWIDQFLIGPTREPVDWLNNFWWWMAAYLNEPLREHPGPLTMPIGVKAERCLIHQTGSHTSGKGFGVESEMLDYDRWLRTPEEFYLMVGATPPLPPLNMETRVRTLEDEVKGIKQHLGLPV